MADTETAKLCVQILQSNFGPLTANVASSLLARGRLTFAQILRYTGLKPRTGRACVLVLVQHNILWHAHTDEEGEVLDINVDECLMRLRFGRYARKTEWLFGKAAREIVELVLHHGKLRPPDILSKLQSMPKSTTVYSQALHKLVDDHYLKPSTISSHVSPQDKQIKFETEERAKIPGLPTAKALREAKQTATVRLVQEERECENIGMTRRSKYSKTGKRKLDEEEMVVDDDVFFRVNFDKFNVHVRNELVVGAVKDRFNDGAALVMRAMLKATERKQRDPSEPGTDPIGATSVMMQLDEERDLELLSSGLQQTSKKPPLIALVKDYLGLLVGADNPTPSGRNSSFASMLGSKVRVEFDLISRRLRRRVLEAVTRERHGDDAVRIVRLLLDTGKMDEKQISKVAMLAPKDVRPLLSTLSADSLITLQEVPKTADRNPARTFYLWYVDLDKAFAVLLGYMYKTLYNISSRRAAETEEPFLKSVLAKCERSDVGADETLLTRMERDVLEEWERRREKLSILEMRVDEAVFIVRDFGNYHSKEE